MHLKPRNTKGETILETIIALSILSIGIIMTSTLMASSLRNINASKNRVIAVNIAREGVEAVRNIRDTNWLKYSSRKRECWNLDPPRDPADGCPSTADPNEGRIEAGEYIVYKQGKYDISEPETFRWRLLKLERDVAGTDVLYAIPDPENLAEYFDARDLYLVDIDPGYDTDSDGTVDNDPDFYNHIYTDHTPVFPSEDDALGRLNAQPTVFKRLVTIEYLENDDPGNDGLIVTSGVDPAYNRMRITADVEWREAKNNFSTSLSTHITDYLGRQSLSL